MLPTPRLPGLFPMPRSHTRMLIVLILFAAACARQPDITMPSPYLIEMLPPQSGVDSLSVRLTNDAGQPITDAEVSLEGNMNHAGMVPVLAGPVADADDGSADGVYEVPFQFTMFGDWIVTASAVVDADAGDTVIANFDLSVDAGGAKLTKP